MNAFNLIGGLVVFFTLQDIDIFIPLHTLHESFGNEIRKPSRLCFSSPESRLLGLQKLPCISELAGL